jgi:hypothetical protein
LGKSLRRCEQEAFVSRILGQQALDQLQAEGNGGADQFGVVIGGERRACTGERIAELIDRIPLYRTTAKQDRAKQNRALHHTGLNQGFRVTRDQ